MENKELEKSIDDFVSDNAPVEPVAPAEPVVPPVTPPVVEPVVPPVVPPVEPPKVPPVEPVVPKEPVVEPIVPKEPVVPVPPVEPIKPVAPVPPVPPVPDQKDTELAQMRETITELRKTIETLASRAYTPPAAPVGADGKPVVATPAPMKFVETEAELDKILNSVDNFNAFLSGVLVKTKESIPTLDTRTVDAIVTQKMAVNEFFVHNPELSGNKAYVGFVADDLAAKNPTWTFPVIMEKLATEVKSRLKMNPAQPAVPPVVEPVADPPAFVPDGGSRRSGGGAQLTRVEAGIADLIEGVM